MQSFTSFSSMLFLSLSLYNCCPNGGPSHPIYKAYNLFLVYHISTLSHGHQPTIHNTPPHRQHDLEYEWESWLSWPSSHFFLFNESSFQLQPKHIILTIFLYPGISMYNDKLSIFLLSSLKMMSSWFQLIRLTINSGD